MKAKELIEYLGGVRPTASKLHVAISTVQGWKQRGRIPARWKGKILQALGDTIPPHVQQALDVGAMGEQKSDQLVAHFAPETSPSFQQKDYGHTKTKKPPARKKLYTLVLAFTLFSVICLVVVATRPLWLPYSTDTKRFPIANRHTPTQTQRESVPQYTVGIHLLSQKVSHLTQQLSQQTKRLQVLEKAMQGQKILQGKDDTYSLLQQKIQKLEQDIQKLGGERQQLQQKIANTSEQFLRLNTKKILLRQMLSVALTGESFAPLLDVYAPYTGDKHMQDGKTANSKRRQAYAVLQKHRNGIKTQRFLQQYLRDNIRTLTADIATKKAKKSWEIVLAKIQNLIYVQNVRAERKGQPVSPIEDLIFLLEAGSLKAAIDQAKTYAVEGLGLWIRMAQNRLDTLNAFRTLLGGI